MRDKKKSQNYKEESLEFTYNIYDILTHIKFDSSVAQSSTHEGSAYF